MKYIKKYKFFESSQHIDFISDVSYELFDDGFSISETSLDPEENEDDN